MSVPSLGFCAAPCAGPTDCGAPVDAAAYCLLEPGATLGYCVTACTDSAGTTGTCPVGLTCKTDVAAASRQPGMCLDTCLTAQPVTCGP